MGKQPAPKEQKTVAPVPEKPKNETKNKKEREALTSPASASGTIFFCKHCAAVPKSQRTQGNRQMDVLYGDGIRPHNPKRRQSGQPQTYRCGGCGQ